MTDETTTHDTVANPRNYGILGAIAAAIAASLCCLGPLALISLGATGAWIGSLSALAPYRLFFMLATASFLGFAFFRVYRPHGEACEPGSVCAKPATKQLSRAGLWLATLLVVVLFASPYVLGRSAAGSQASLASATTTARLAVRGMTCEACSATVRKSLTRLDGVVDARVSLDPPRAIVEFDAAVVTAAELAEATAAVGYPSHIVE